MFTLVNFSFRLVRKHIHKIALTFISQCGYIFIWLSYDNK